MHGRQLIPRTGTGTAATVSSPSSSIVPSSRLRWPHRNLVALREGTPSVVSGTTVQSVDPLALLLIAGFGRLPWPPRSPVTAMSSARASTSTSGSSTPACGPLADRRVDPDPTSAQLSRLLFLVTLPVGIAFLLTSRWLLRAALNHRRRSGTAMTPTLLVGTPDDVEQLRRAMSRRCDAGYRVVAVSAQPTAARGSPWWRQICHRSP